MWRFAIRDVMWVMVVAGLLVLWAGERKWRSIDWAKAIKNEGRLYDRIDEQKEQMRKLGAQFRVERELRAKAERRLAEVEAAGRKAE
jgi:hypothetical protein